MSEKELEQVQEAFESSEHYFCGESPADRIVNWAVWKSAWQAALASQEQQPTDLSEQLREYAGNSGYSHNDYADTMLAAASEIERLTASQAQQPSTELKEMEARKDAAYLERNQVVAALTKCFPSGTTKTAIEGWSEDWHSCVYIDLPTGQASWHYHDSQAYLFADLPAYTGKWDGHTTEEKYSRIAKLQSQAQQEIEIDMLTGDVTWKFNEAQTQEPLEIQALTTICKLLDGSQPKDPLGALFVAQPALRQSQAQQEPLKVSENWREPLSADAMQRLKSLGLLDKSPAPEGGDK